jgi:hypothetical protein
MGEKGNLLDTGEGIFANLAEQGPQFWFDYEQYKQSRAAQARVGAEQQAAGQDTPAKFDLPAPRASE